MLIYGLSVASSLIGRLWRCFDVAENTSGFFFSSSEVDRRWYVQIQNDALKE